MLDIHDLFGFQYTGRVWSDREHSKEYNRGFDQSAACMFNCDATVVYLWAAGGDSRETGVVE